MSHRFFFINESMKERKKEEEETLCFHGLCTPGATQGLKCFFLEKIQSFCVHHQLEKRENKKKKKQLNWKTDTLALKTEHGDNISSKQQNLTLLCCASDKIYTEMYDGIKNK